MDDKKPQGKLEKLTKMNSSFWVWASRSWWTRGISGICLIIIVLRLATTCVDVWGIKIGCKDNQHDIHELFTPHDDVHAPEFP